jgi:flagellar capping protein FliD
VEFKKYYLQLKLVKFDLTLGQATQTSFNCKQTIRRQKQTSVRDLKEAVSDFTLEAILISRSSC